LRTLFIETIRLCVAFNFIPRINFLKQHYTAVSKLNPVSTEMVETFQLRLLVF